MRLSAPRKWSGQLYDPGRGRTFSGNLIEIDQIRSASKGARFSSAAARNCIASSE